MSTNGINSSTILLEVKKILRILPQRIKLIVCVSLDSVLDENITNRGVAGASLKQKESIDQLLELANSERFWVVMSFTITKSNYKEIIPAYKYAATKRIQIEYVYATVNTAFITSAPLEKQFCLSNSEVLETINSLQEVENLPWLASDKRYFCILLKKLRGERFEAPCLGRDKKSILVEPDGQISLCGMAKEAYLGNISQDTLGEILTRDATNLDRVCSDCTTNGFAYSTNGYQYETDIMNYVRRTKGRR